MLTKILLILTSLHNLRRKFSNQEPKFNILFWVILVFRRIKRNLRIKKEANSVFVLHGNKLLLDNKSSILESHVKVDKLSCIHYTFIIWVFKKGDKQGY